MKSNWVKHGPREYEIRCDGVTVESHLTRYAAMSDIKWRIAYDNPAATIEVIHTPTGITLDTIEPAKAASGASATRVEAA